jgi:hypothetical protein
MSDDFRNQIYASLNLKETGELLEIWQKNDRIEWSDTAFDVIREILLRRLGAWSLPHQNEAIIEQDEEGDGTSIDEDEEENEPVFYDPLKVLSEETWLRRAAIASIIVIILGAFQQISRIQQSLMSFFSIYPILYYSVLLIVLIGMVLAVIALCVIVYFSLNAFASILKILMEMEFNSRGYKS